MVHFLQLWKRNMDLKKKNPVKMDLELKIEQYTILHSEKNIPLNSSSRVLLCVDKFNLATRSAIKRYSTERIIAFNKSESLIISEMLDIPCLLCYDGS